MCSTALQPEHPLAIADNCRLSNSPSPSRRVAKPLDAAADHVPHRSVVDASGTFAQREVVSLVVVERRDGSGYYAKGKDVCTAFVSYTFLDF